MRRDARAGGAGPRAAVLVLSVLSVAAGAARAEEQYGTPSGPLARVHQSASCARCHLPTGDVPQQKCLDCHRPLDQQIQAARGLHASPRVRSMACALCHKEHRGVDTDIRGWKRVGGVEGFDHSLTGFPLTGRHAGHRCQDCHDKLDPSGTPLSPGQDKSRTCLPCHADYHEGQLWNDCRRCHGAERWQVEGTFDHNQQTSYRLEGKHLRMAQRNRCQLCHQSGWNKRFKPTPTQCGDARCHQKDDEHKGTYGPSCSDCHRSFEAFGQDVQDAKSGHNLSPQPFAGAHDQVTRNTGCRTCHDGRKLRGMGSMCISCHQRDDIHHNSLGPRCNDCHTQRTFAGGRFRHDTVGCTLRGVHRVLPCADCHKGGNYAALSPMCISCHRDDAMRAAGVVIRNIANPVAPELHVLQTACTHCHNTVSFRLGAGTRQSPPESVCQ